MNIQIILFVALLACPFLALVTNFLPWRKKPVLTAHIASSFIGIGALLGVVLLTCLPFSKAPTVYLLIGFNTLGLLLCTLILLVSFVVHRFSIRYMDGDRLYCRYFLTLAAITCSAVIMVLADNLLLFWFAWSLSNVLLITLMVHKNQWAAAKNSGWLALSTLLPGSLSMIIAFVLINITTHTTSIQVLVQQSSLISTPVLFVALSLIICTAATQSALWPFHRWLISSLNSPTPVSALMHAGLVNGGGILIVKFAPLFAMHKGLLTVLFIFGAISALLGTIWKLMQSDIKRMLACSTLAQMGFMMMQCGVGLFAAAIAHLCWHGLFKAYLFLSSGSAVKQKKSVVNSSKASPGLLLASLTGGAVAMTAFAFATNKPVSLFEANAFVLFFAFIAGAQLMFTWVRSHQTPLSLISALVLAFFTGLMYGGSIHLVEFLIPSISTIQAPQLSSVHWVAMILFGSLWVIFNLGVHQTMGQSKLGYWLYMNLFNSSQPSRKTMTALRNDYNY
ncbi:proton-conducting transporter membrane subunit [Legionella feeleii]|uniref:NADH-ubiquinone oxidoreductase chain 5 n=1 Tax=Legionella feeleii TaxID=453 RepID=A0A378IX61_9GAMM|nr:proton-conducting transporter membrane subunit [Legionella feeleii]STX39827.1 NADH-ubiquinone oxidoreductase chain 5 [Legionella feeleii]